jgi:hypothetical protein
MDSEAFANMIKPTRTYQLTGGAPQTNDNDQVLTAIKQLETTISPLKQQLQLFQQSQEKSIATLTSVADEIKSEVASLAKLRTKDASNLLQSVQQVSTALTKIQSPAEKQSAVEPASEFETETAVSTTTPEKDQPGLMGRVESLERRIVLLADQL